jgi:hypothetical protein
MLKHWLIELIGHVSGLSDAQGDDTSPGGTMKKYDLLGTCEMAESRLPAFGYPPPPAERKPPQAASAQSPGAVSLGRPELRGSNNDAVQDRVG